MYDVCAACDGFFALRLTTVEDRPQELQKKSLTLLKIISIKFLKKENYFY